MTPRIFTGMRLPGLRLLAVCTALTAFTAAFAGQGNVPVTTSAAAWASIQNGLPSANHPGAVGQTVDWTAVAASAEAFLQSFPGDGNAPAAQRIELVALIRAEDGKPQVNPGTLDKAAAFLADATHPVRDRLEVTIASAQATLVRTPFPSRAARLKANEAHARDLIRRFPGEPEGYGYLLGQAKAEESPNARAIVQELLSSNAPAGIKDDATRVQARLDLEGKLFQLTGSEGAIAAARGHVLVVYAWTGQDVGYLPVIKRMAVNPNLRFIGINLDSTTPDKALTATLPGLQLRERGGLNGPLGKQLQLLMTPSVYLIDPQGLVHDVNAFVTAEDKATELASKGGSS